MEERHPLLPQREGKEITDMGTDIDDWSRDNTSPYDQGNLTEAYKCECASAALQLQDFLERESLKETPIGDLIEAERSKYGLLCYTVCLGLELHEAEKMIQDERDRWFGYAQKEIDMEFTSEWLPHLFKTWFEETGGLLTQWIQTSPGDDWCRARHWIKQQYYAQEEKTKRKRGNK